MPKKYKRVTPGIVKVIKKAYNAIKTPKKVKIKLNPKHPTSSAIIKHNQRLKQSLSGGEPSSTKSLDSTNDYSQKLAPQTTDTKQSYKKTQQRRKHQ